MAILSIPAVPLLLCWVPLAIGRSARRAAVAWATAAVALLSIAGLVAAAPAVVAGELVTARVPWIPSLGLDLALRLDGLALLMCVLVLGIGELVILYARYYLAPDDDHPRFYAFLLLFMGGMLGVVTAESLLVLVASWELTSASSFLLVGFYQQEVEARRGARRALAVTGLGGLCLLLGVLLLGDIAGSTELRHVLVAHDAIVVDPRYPVVLGLLLVGVLTKSAQLPFHFWLPGAMSAPTPASAYLHSAAMVKAGVFLLVRLWPALGGTALWFFLVTGVGLATLLFGAFAALYQDDLKGLLAYSTISHLGLITALTGFDRPMAVVAAVFHIVNHAIFKASLFMAVGIVDHETGTRDIRRLGGLARTMPVTAILATIAAAAMAGIPLVNGFLSKEMFFREAVEVGDAMARVQWLVPAIATLAGVLSVAYSVRFTWDAFVRAPPAPLRPQPHPPPPWMRMPVLLLAALVLLVGLAPQISVQPLLVLAARAILGADAPPIDLQVWHGFTVPFAMSLVAIASGIGLYLVRGRLLRLLQRLPAVPSGEAIYGHALRGVFLPSRFLTGHLHDGSLARPLRLFLLCALAAGIVPFLTHAPPPPVVVTSPLPPLGPLLLLVLGLGAVATVVFHRRRLLALVVLGITGLASALSFVALSAPDLAFTQLAVEFVTVVLMLLALRFLPPTAPPDRAARRTVDAAIAAAVGVGVAAVLYEVLTRPGSSISSFYLAHSEEHGGGHNVVNVILVDFRAFDTLGEIVVLGIAAVAIAALLHGLRRRATGDLEHVERLYAERHPFMLRVLTRPMLPMLLLLAVYILLRGHDLPGGGFVAGLVVATALVLQFVASGLSWASQRARVDSLAPLVAGLSVALATGLVAMAAGQPLLTSGHVTLHLGLLEVPLSSTLAFDVGVMLTVASALMLVLVRLGRASEQPPEPQPQPPRADEGGGD